MRVILGADHGGWRTKEMVKFWLKDMNYEIVDVGGEILDKDDDYVDFAMKAVSEIALETDRVVLFCRNGMGMAIVANKKKGVRCGLGFGPEAVRKGRRDDDINALAIPADYCTDEGVKEMIKVFLETEFSTEERYAKRLLKLKSIEEQWLK